MSTGLALLLFYVSGALAISFLCSLLEAGLLSVRETELAARATGGDKGAAILLDLKQNRIDDAISAILTLNTIAHTIGATLAGAQAARVFGNAWVGVFSGILTLLVLIVTEIIPKTLGAVYASRFVGFVGRTSSLLIRLLLPIVAATRALTRLLVKQEKTPITRAEIAALLAAAAGQGTVRRDQKRVFDNVLQLDEILVGDVMTPPHRAYDAAGFDYHRRVPRRPGRPRLHSHSPLWRDPRRGDRLPRAARCSGCACPRSREVQTA